MCSHTLASVPTSSDLIPTREVLEILRRSDPSTVSRYVLLGRLTPAVRAPGKRGAMFFERADAERLRAELDAEEAAAS